MSGSVSQATDAGSTGDESRRHVSVYVVLVALILVAPLPFGAYPTWAWASLSAGCGILLVAWGVSVIAGRVAVVLPPALVLWSALLLGLSLLWGFIQTTGLTPQDWHHPIWFEAEGALGPSIMGAVSLDPKEGRNSLLRLISYVGIFWLAVQYNRDSRRTSYTLRALIVCSAGNALYGLTVIFLGTKSILWFDKTDYTDMATGTFVNPNHFGIYCGIGLLCATAMLFRRFRFGMAGRTGAIERSRFVLLKFIPRNALILIAWMVLMSALLLSLSRGAAAATGLAMVTLIFILSLRRKTSVSKALIRAGGVVLMGVLLLLVVGQGLGRHLWEIDNDFAKRAEIYSQTLTAIADRPLLGTGLGTFPTVYRSYRTAEIRPGVTMAHNDYLEMLLELGIPAGTLFVFALLMLAGLCARGVWMRRREYEYPALGFAVCVLMGLHSLVDFSLQIPAVAATFALVFGIAVAQSQSTGKRTMKQG